MKKNSNPLPSFSSELILKLLTFVDTRDWDKFHSPKNLAMAITGEVGELAEHFQWMSEDDSNNLDQDKKNRVAEEIADIFLYILLLSHKLGINLEQTTIEKISINESKYPVAQTRGSSKKYSEY